MRGLDGVASREVGDGASELDSAVVAARGELHRARGALERVLGFFGEVRDRFDVFRPHVGVGENAGALESFPPPFPRLRYLLPRLSRFPAHSF